MRALFDVVAVLSAPSDSEADTMGFTEGVKRLETALADVARFAAASASDGQPLMVIVGSAGDISATVRVD
jgi:hypothetical protein